MSKKKCITHLNVTRMNKEEIEQAIEKKKRDISDYLRIVQLLNVTKEERERQLNLMLDDLAKLMKQRNEM